MISRLTDWLGSIEITEPQEAGRLRVFGLRWSHGTPLRYGILDEALAAKTLEITEVNQSGAVPTLMVNNRSKEMVFLLVGEQLIGAKQNRILSASMMIPPEATIPIPVSCSEAGRWHYQTHRFSSPGTMAFARMRRKMSRQVRDSYRSQGYPAADQLQVWDDVAMKLSALKTQSPSGALHDCYEANAQRLKDILDLLHAPKNCGGVVFTIGGAIAGADLFDNPVTLAKLFPKLVRAFALDALEAQALAPTAGVDQVREWLQSVTEATTESFKSPGLGQDVRLRGKALIGSCLSIDEHPVHLELFPLETQLQSEEPHTTPQQPGPADSTVDRPETLSRPQPASCGQGQSSMSCKSGVFAWLVNLGRRLLRKPIKNDFPSTRDRPE